MKTINTYNAYNQRRYSLPWVCEYDVTTGKYNFEKKIGRYTAKAGDAGELVVIEPVKGQVYAYGQKDYRGGNTEKLYAIYNGEKFVACDNCGRTLEAEEVEIIEKVQAVEIAIDTNKSQQIIANAIKQEEPEMKTMEELKANLDEQVLDGTLDIDVYNDYVAQYADPGEEIYYTSDLNELRNELPDTEEFDNAVQYAKENGNFDEDDTYFYFSAANRELRLYTAPTLAATFIDTELMANRLYSAYERNPKFVTEHFPTIAEFLTA